MLQRIRDGLQGQKWLAWVILGAIALTFVLWGGAGQLDLTGTSKDVAAEVNGSEIPAIEAQQQWTDIQQRFSRQYGSEVPASEKAAIQSSIIDELVLRKVIEQRLQEQSYRIGQEQVFASWREDPSYQTDGKYDVSKLSAFLQSAGKTEREFYRDTEISLLGQQLRAGLENSFFLTPAEQQRLANLENEEREVQYLRLSVDKFLPAGPVEDEAIKAYYDKNGDRFMSTEYVALDYAELRLEQLATQVAPTEADLRKLYDDNRALYVQEETRRARHIVIGVNEGEADAAALAQAEKVVAEARAGKDFAALAQQYSTDPTKAQGGDLGFVKRSDFKGPIGDAIFGMKVGDVSAPVKSQYGYHILKLEEIAPQQERPFDDVRAELDSQYRQEKAAELFSDRQDQIQALLDKGVTDLDQIARELGMTRGSVPQFLRGGGGEPLGSSPELQSVVFADATLNQGKVGGPVPLGDDRFVLVKVALHHKAAVRPLAEVREEIVDLLRRERAEAAAKVAAEDAIKKLEAGTKIEDLAKSLGVTVDPPRFVGRADPSVPAALRTALFNTPRPAGKPLIQSAVLDSGAAVFVLTAARIADTSANPALVQQQNEQRLRAGASRDIASYVAEALRKAKIVKNPKVFAE